MVCLRFSWEENENTSANFAVYLSLIALNKYEMMENDKKVSVLHCWKSMTHLRVFLASKIGA